jgi:3-deoxy-D-manno-octulosonate 8-phosphate phosphatase (KDO 8-P phosphatase)
MLNFLMLNAKFHYLAYSIKKFSIYHKKFTIKMDSSPELKNILSYFKYIDTFFLDVDGVLTDGKVLVTEAGEFLRSFNAKDGYAIRRAVEEGYKVVVITGGKGGSVENRLRYLGIKQFYTNAADKLPILKTYLRENNIDSSTVLYMGDDLNDFEVMQNVGLPCCPADAANEIRNISHYISPLEGGQGCVRDVIEKVMKLQGKWMNHISVSG